MLGIRVLFPGRAGEASLQCEEKAETWNWAELLQKTPSFLKTDVTLCLILQRDFSFAM